MNKRTVVWNKNRGKNLYCIIDIYCKCKKNNNNKKQKKIK